MAARILLALVGLGPLLLLLYWGIARHDLVGTLVSLVAVGMFVVASAIARRRRVS